MLESTGVPTREQVDSVFPTDERLSKGPVAVIECYQNIPCNPCYTACNRYAIKEFKDINDLPNIEHENCNGCGLCIANCPGLAIMVVDTTFSDTHALMKIPYELNCLPGVGDVVKGVDRGGEYVCDVRVNKIMTSKVLDRTNIIAIEVPKDMVRIVRNFMI